MIRVDASVAIEWVASERDSPQALARSRPALARGHDLVAPRILAFEATDALLRRCLRNGLDIADARTRLGDLLLVPVRYLHRKTIKDEALVLADAFGLPAAYGAHDLALAERERCDVSTSNRRLLNAVGERFPSVPDLGAFDASSF